MSTKAAAGTREAVFEVAQRNVGFIEGPGNHNPFAPLVGHAQGQPWCASFVAAVFKRAGVPLPSTSAYTPTMAAGFKTEGSYHPKGQPGDVVFFRWPSLGRIAHVGIVLEARRDGSYLTVEGNTDIAGGRTGGRVMRVIRRANIDGFGRPSYKPSRPATGGASSPLLQLGSGGRDASAAEQAKVKDIQRALLKLGYLKGKAGDVVDGDFGDLTKKALLAFQRKEGLSRTGRTDPTTWARLRHRVHG